MKSKLISSSNSLLGVLWVNNFGKNTRHLVIISHVVVPILELEMRIARIDFDDKMSIQVLDADLSVAQQDQPVRVVSRRADLQRHVRVLRDELHYIAGFHKVSVFRLFECAVDRVREFCHVLATHNRSGSIGKTRRKFVNERRHFIELVVVRNQKSNDLYLNHILVIYMVCLK